MYRTITAALLLAAAQAIKISRTLEGDHELSHEPEITDENWCFQFNNYDVSVTLLDYGAEVDFALGSNGDPNEWVGAEYWVHHGEDGREMFGSKEKPVFLEPKDIDYDAGQEGQYGVKAVTPVKRGCPSPPCPLPGLLEKALFDAINEKDESTALEILDVKGCPVNLKHEIFHQGFSSQASALHMTIENNMHEVALKFIYAGPVVNERAPGLHNQAPLCWACHGSVEENPALIKELIRAGANPEQQDDGGWTALHCCAAEDRADSITAILEARRWMDLNIKNNGGKTALGTAELKGKSKAADALRAKGATEL